MQLELTTNVAETVLIAVHRFIVEANRRADKVREMGYQGFADSYLMDAAEAQTVKDQLESFLGINAAELLGE